jgi:hypothetical protein
LTLPTLAAGMNFTYISGTAPGSTYTFTITATGALIYLDGSSTAKTNIIFGSGFAVGNGVACFSFQTGASAYSLSCTTLRGSPTTS